MAAAEPTIYDVAATAGVSISTVSLALNKPSRLSETTLSKVMRAIDDLGYVPRAVAVARARQGVTRIGVIAPFTAYPSFGIRLNGVLKVASSQSLEVIVFDEQSAATARLAGLPIARPVDGVLLMALPFSEEVAQRLQEGRVETVLIDIEHPDFSSVSTDDYEGGVLAGRLLRSHGHERTAFLGHAQSVDYESSSRQRERGFRSALDVQPQLVVADYALESARAACLPLLRAVDRPTAIFAYDDIMAAGVLRAAAQVGLRVPEDLEVIGYDDTLLAAGLGLTTVRQPLEETGRIGAQLLLERMGHPDTAKQRVRLGLQLIERASTR